uniref:Uncharacterized protein n=1 Tax=Lygus hesperus TaxID=30085 RepID=A0A146M3K3_LYGHE
MVNSKNKKSKKSTRKKKNSTQSKVKNVKVKEEKKFDIIGQKYEKPSELDVLRLFYESAYRENPKSEMAARWCLAHGLLPNDIAEAMVKQDTKPRSSTSSKSAKSARSTASSKESKKSNKDTKDPPPLQPSKNK